MNHYEVLGVSRGADLATIRAAHRSRARRCHPDVGGDEREMMRVNEAWRVLRDPRLRTRHDAELEAIPRPVAVKSVDEPLGFGRYAGMAINEVARLDPDYLEWLARTPAGRSLRSQIEAALAY